MFRLTRVLLSLGVTLSLLPTVVTAQPAAPIEYRVLATSKTSTMEKELNEAAQVGFRFMSVMGGDTAFGGKEVVAVLGRRVGSTSAVFYKLLATNKTSTMQKELQEAADAGYAYVGQTVFESLFGGKEVVVILERDPANKPPVSYEYKLMATSKTSTMQKEVQSAGDQGYEVIGMTVGKTLLGGNELVVISRRAKR